MLWYYPPPVGLVAHLNLLRYRLREAFGEYAAKVDRTAGPTVWMISGRLSRRIARFAALLARFHAGTLPPKRDEGDAELCERPMRTRAPVKRAPDPLPRGRGWLLKMIQPVAGNSDHLASLLKDPEMVALMAATPQAARLLRPLWWMLSLKPYPVELRPPPPRPRRKRPADRGDDIVSAADGAPERTPSREPSGSTPTARVRARARARRNPKIRA